jgi:sulfatase maturation enzyme AslB (radical SAM superfamily)
LNPIPATPAPTGFQRIPGCSLPIHAAADAGRALFYAPRLLCILDNDSAPAVRRHIGRLISSHLPAHDPRDAAVSAPLAAARQLVRAARESVDEQKQKSVRDFTPECLTIYVNNRCNLNCSYCYSANDGAPPQTVSGEAVRAASRLVAGACASRNIPFTLVFHGGGEPALNPPSVDRMLDIAAQETAERGIPLRTYIASNGVIPEDAAEWLAGRFDLVGISCDGPPAIHDRQRPARDGHPTSAAVDRTIGVLRRRGRPFHIRATLAERNFHRQAEIVAYLGAKYAPSEIRLEPVYNNLSGEPAPEASSASAFADGFLAAQAEGMMHSVRVTTSVTRLDSVFGPYCNVLRGVLNLVPGDVGSGCFLESRPVRIEGHGLKTGSMDSQRMAFNLDAARLRELSARCSARSPGCLDCLCGHQCTFGCPDRCVLDAPGKSEGDGRSGFGFRCAANRTLAEQTIRAAGARAWTATAPGSCGQTTDAFSDLKVAVFRDSALNGVNT